MLQKPTAYDLGLDRVDLESCLDMEHNQPCYNGTYQQGVPQELPPEPTTEPGE